MGITNLDSLTLSGTLIAPNIIGTVASQSAVVATPDDGTTQTLTAAMIVGGGAWTFHTTTGGTTPSLTLPTAANIIAGITGWAVGDSYVLRIINANSGTATVLTNTGITLTGTATISTNSEADFVVTMASATTVTVVRSSKELSTNGLTITTTTGTLTVPNGVTLTGPAVSGTAATLAGTETLTNKTLTSPTLTTPALGVATATSVNGLTVTTSTGTLTVPNGVVLTGPATSGTAATLAGTETLTNKTLASNLFIPNETRCGTQVDSTGTTLANITNLTQVVVIGTYKFRAVLKTTCGGTGGVKLAFNYTTTVLSAIDAMAYGYTATAIATASTTTTTTQTSIISSATAFTSVIIEGTMTVSTGGTVDLQFAENNANSTSSVLVGSTLEFTRIA